MVPNPLVCICVPTYNAANTVKESLESILAQTYSNLVVHISDNASTDDTLKVLKCIDDPRVYIHPQKENIGGEGNFTRCIQMAEGKYTAIFHADDVYEPEMVAKQVAFLEANSGAGAVFTQSYIIDDKGTLKGSMGIPKGIKTKDNLYDFITIFKAILRHSNFFICPSAMVRTEVYKKDIQEWKGSLFKSSADLDVWLRILKKYTVGILLERLILYRVSESQFSARLRSRIERADMFLVIDHYMEKDKVKSWLTKNDILHYARLKRTDRVVRSINLYLLGDKKRAYELCGGALSFDACLAAFGSRRGLITFVAGVLVKFLCYFKLDMTGQFILSSLKKMTGK